MMYTSISLALVIKLRNIFCCHISFWSERLIGLIILQFIMMSINIGWIINYSLLFFRFWHSFIFLIALATFMLVSIVWFRLLPNQLFTSPNIRYRPRSRFCSFPYPSIRYQLLASVIGVSLLCIPKSLYRVGDCKLEQWESNSSGLGKLWNKNQKATILPRWHKYQQLCLAD